jgi:hypothetical protein
MKVVLGCIGMLSLALVVPPAVAQACSTQDFCTGWNVVCHRTLPKGADAKECSRRRADCLKTGCYHFNSPRARCRNNPEDVAMTISCRRRG